MTQVELRINEAPPFLVELTDASLSPGGQEVPFPATEVDDLELEVTGVSQPPFDPALANAVGFAEVRVGDVVVTERVRVPTDLLERAGGGRGHRVDVVLTRLRYEPGERGRQDQERSLQRSLDIPMERSFALTGAVRVNPNAPGERLDEVLATDLGGAAVTSSSHLAGDLASRGSRALDQDDATAWQAAIGAQDGQHLTVRLPRPTAVGALVVSVVQDDRHSRPRSLTLLADGEPVGTVPVPTATGDGLVEVTLPDPSGPVRELRLVVGDVEPKHPVPGAPNPVDILPVAIAELAGTGLPVARDAVDVDAGCRPLLTVDGEPVPVRVVGSQVDARRGLALEPCSRSGALTLAAGPHTIASVIGLDGGLDVDRLVLSSGADGTPGAVAARGVPRSEAGAELDVRSEQRGEDYDLTVDSDGEPFWLVLGQSDNHGWSLDVSGATVGERQIVDGFANGWLITPEGAGDLDVSITWGPQRLVWVTLAASALAVLACLAIIVIAGRRPTDGDAGRVSATDPELARPPAGRSSLTPGAPGLVVGAGVVVLLVATPLAAAVASVAVLVGLLVPRATWAWLAAAPVLVVLARILERPALAWAALALLAADLTVDRWRDRSLSRASRGRARRPAPAG